MGGRKVTAGASPPAAVRTVRRGNETRDIAVRQYKKIYVDAYNLLRRDHRLARLMKSNADAARRSFVELVGSRLRHAQQCVVVFDGNGEAISSGSRLSVVFSNTRTADSWIRMRLEKETDRKSVLVVSSDREVCNHAAVCGAGVLSAEAFLAGKEEANGAEGQEKPEGRLSAKEVAEWKRLFGGDA